MRQQKGQEMVLLRNAFQVIVMAYESWGPLPRLPKLPEDNHLEHVFKMQVLGFSQIWWIWVSRRAGHLYIEQVWMQAALTCHSRGEVSILSFPTQWRVRPRTLLTARAEQLRKGTCPAWIICTDMCSWARPHWTATSNPIPAPLADSPIIIMTNFPAKEPENLQIKRKPWWVICNE